eukprot:TRINITY_DN27221_c0_g1_i1.p1 TRINITY_DN27221_c0_g1~~TRINITY_DN27221_c0_g1_i1.p1  ORF type:complete len:372 (-),score=61.56 TRINITY_DN27221_c0_g1_i1:79-1098(-)
MMSATARKMQVDFQSYTGVPTMPQLHSYPLPGTAVPTHQLAGTQVLTTRRLTQEEGCCGEDACLDEAKFGAEDRAPSDDYTFCGFDMKPILPVALSVSTVIGGMCMLLVQLPMLSRFMSWSETMLLSGFAALYAATLSCMMYCTFADPGQMRKDTQSWQMGLPKRAHQSWQYPRPIRRYDHYCKWLQNVIGLLNHREFVAMVLGLLVISILGIAVDVWLGLLLLKKAFYDTAVVVLGHLSYSIALLFIAGPICKIHVGLVSRNEVAQEWKNNDFYVAPTSRKGTNVPVPHLDDDEYNALFDENAFIYDASRNQWDQGCCNNCCAFWCNSRWSRDERGEW